jgi:hypothetical protein
MCFKEFKRAIAYCVLHSCFKNCISLLRRYIFKVAMKFAYALWATAWNKAVQ